jgi:hypothetical protein
VNGAGGCGWLPFSICKLCNSHVSISHGALGHVRVSVACLCSRVVSTVGAIVPILVFKSPQTTEGY